MKATTLETAIFEWLSDRHEALGSCLERASVTSREHSGAGLYVHLGPRGAAPWDRSPVNGPVIESSQLEFGGGCLLWLSQGEPACLEIYAFGNHFPSSLDDFTLSEVGASA